MKGVWYDDPVPQSADRFGNDETDLDNCGLEKYSSGIEPPSGPHQRRDRQPNWWARHKARHAPQAAAAVGCNERAQAEQQSGERKGWLRYALQRQQLCSCFTFLRQILSR